MKTAAPGTMQVEAELRASVATVQLVQFEFLEPPDNIFRREDSYSLDFCLTPRPRNARACYPDRWGSKRFESLGHVFLVPPGESMLARSDSTGQQVSLFCQLKQEAMREWLEEDLVWSDRDLAAGLDIRDANIQSLLMRLVQEVKHPGFASEMLVELIAAQLAIELTRYRQSSGDIAVTGGLASWRLRVIDERLEEVGVMPTLEKLARLCGLSVRQLTRAFRVSRGTSIGDYVADSRIEQARRMLATDQSVKAIAYTLGFSSPSSFCYAFRRATGETPGNYRQRLLKPH